MPPWVDKRFRKVKYYNAHMMHSVLGASGVGVGAETAGITEAEVATNLGFIGNIIVAGEFIVGFIRCPYDLDPSKPVYVRVIFSSTNSGSLGITWVALVKFTKTEIALVAPGTLVALDTIIAEKDTAASKASVATSWGKMDTPGISRADVEAGAIFQTRIECDIIDSGHTVVTFLGIEFGYTPMNFIGPGPNLSAPPASAQS